MKNSIEFLPLFLLVLSVNHQKVSDAFQFHHPRQQSSGSGVPGLQSPFSSCSRVLNDEDPRAFTALLVTSQDDTISSTDVASYEDYVHKMEQLARRTFRDETAMDQAETLMQEIEADQDVETDIELYNLLWEAYAFAKNRPDGADLIAQQIQQLEDSDDVSRPNLQSYTNLMQAYMQRSDLSNVEKVFESLTVNENPNLQPDISIYNKLIQAYGVLGKPDSAKELVQRLLENDSDEQESNVVSPDAKTWIHLLRALSTAGRIDEIQEYMRNVMLRGYRMEGRDDWKPNVHSYNALIRAMMYSKEKDQVETRHEQIEGLLYHMIQLHREEERDEEDDTTNDDDDGKILCMRPNSETFYLVIQSFRGATHSGIGDKIERILELQRGLALACNDDSLYPDTRTYNMAIAVLSRARDSQKAVRAQRLLEEMDEPDLAEVEEGAGLRPSARPTLTTYRNILNACAFTRGSAEDRLTAFQLAVEAFNQVRLVKPQIDSIQTDESMVSIYQLFLQACFHLMAPSNKRDTVVEKVFTKCCKEGYLSDRILNQVLLRHASDQLHLKLLGGFIEDGAEPPVEWSRNVPASAKD